MATATTAAALVIPFVLQADLHGRIYRGDCEEKAARPSLAIPTGFDVEPVVVSAGDLLGPAPEARFPVELGGAGHAALASLLGGRFDAVIPGNFELSLDRAHLAAVTATAGIPWTVANLSPGFPHRSERIVERAGIRIGITGVVDDQLQKRLHPIVRTERLVKAAPALAASIRRLRALDAKVVAAVAHVSGSRGASAIVRLVDALGEDVPDLLMTSALDGDVRSMDLARVRVVPAPREGAAVARVLVAHGGVRLLSRGLIRASEDTAPAEERLRRINCRRLGAPVATIDRPLTREDMVRYVLEVMRRHTQSEVAIINAGAFGDGFPLAGPVNRLAVFRALRVDDGLRVSRVLGSNLVQLMPLLTNDDAAVLGLGLTEAAGRKIDPSRRYRVVTVDFVASGGDGLIDPALFDFQPQPAGGRRLRALVVEHLAEHGGALVVETPALLGAYLSISANLKSVSVDRGEGYEAPQLTRNDFIGVTGVGDLRLSADFARHRMELHARTRYGIAKDGREPAAEIDDVTTGELSYLGRLAARGHAFWVPDASAAVSMQTEITKPEETRFRRALLTAGVGPSWPLEERISLRVQLGMRRELLADSDSADPSEARLAETRMAVLSTLELLRIDFPTELGPPVLVTMRLDHAYDLTGEVRDNIFQGRLDLDVPITSQLAVTAGLEAYVQHRMEAGLSNPIGAAFDTNIGLKTSGDLSMVLF